LSHPQIASGAAIVEFVNRGEDPHDLRIRPAAGGQDLLAFGVGLPGSHVDQSTALPPGTYVLYCALPGHEAAGMHVTLTVG
jgi:plastocyanin